MTARVFAFLGLALAALAFLTSRYERRSAGAFAHYAEDMAELDALRGATAALDRSVLESRAGIQLNFDPVNGAVRSLRTASREADAIRARGPAYAEAADALERLADEMRGEEPSLETLKTDLALLRLSSRYFPIAADALSHPGEASSRQLQTLRIDLTRYQQGAAPELGWRIGSELAALDTGLRGLETRIDKVGSLRADVERYEESPVREVAQRLESEISALDAARPGFDEAVQADLDVLLGHTRAILERRERVDRIVRSVVRSAIATDLEAATAAYERGARHELGTALALRIAAAELAALALAMLAAAWASSRQSRRRTAALRD